MAHVYPVLVHIEDTDFGGVVYHPNYLKMYERARIAWLEEMGFGLGWQLQQELFFVIRGIEIEYFKPARLAEQLEVVTHITELGRSSVSFEQRMTKQSAPDTVINQIKIHVVAISKDFKPTSIPHELREELNNARE